MSSQAKRKVIRLDKDNKILFGIAITGLVLTLLAFLLDFRIHVREAAADYAANLQNYSERIEHELGGGLLFIGDLQGLFYTREG